MSTRHHHKSSKKQRLTIKSIVAMIVIFALLVGAVLFVVKRFDTPGSDTGGIVTHKSSSAAGEEERVYINGKWYKPKTEIRKTLLIGVDDFGQIREEDLYNNHSQADFLLLLAKNEETGETFSIQINRDTMTSVQVLSVTGQVAGREIQQIALAHTYGSGGEDSCDNTLQAVKNFLYDIPMTEYIAMTMDGVAVLNDEVGGVTLKSLVDFPQLGVKKDEKITLTGDQALTYVRARSEMADPTNLARQERQRQYILAWSNLAKDKFKTRDKALELIEHISPYITTNCDAITLAGMAEQLSEYETAPIYSPEGEAVQGEQFVEFYADEEKLKEMILALFFVEGKE